MGQMVRGGRSWPSDKKLGAGVKGSVKRATPKLSGDATVRAEVIIGVIEHRSQHRPHLSTPSWGPPASDAIEC